MSKLLEVTDLHASYGAIRALRGISFSVDAGQVVTLIGANGAGKSTTLNTLSGFIKPTGGRVMFNGADITAKRPDRITAAGLVQVPEGRQIIANMSVMENLQMGGYLMRGREREQKEIQQIFERFPRLGERHDQKAGSLSGGEQQMLAIGRALMAHPTLVMLDEPSMGLAPLLVNDVFDIIREIKAAGTPILLVEQNARKALQIADYAYVLERGSITHHGPAAELREDNRIVESYLG
ncbi:MAG: ABC transporter ATP-binding protein [Chloroflexota bacterium]